MLKHIVVILSLAALPVSNVLAQEVGYDQSDYTTCAVYHRMFVGYFQRVKNLPTMAELEKEKMTLLMERAQEMAVADFGDEFGEEMFQEEWQAVLAEMTDRINRNYENVSRLKGFYQNRCRKVLDSIKQE